MGYRSVVSIYILENEDTRKVVGPLEDIIDGALKVDMSIDSSYFKIGENSKGERILLLELTDYKWYPGYDSVKYWDSIMNKLENEELQDTYLFFRLGEEVGDFESQGELGEVYDFTDCDVDIDFKTDDDKLEYAFEDIRTFVRNELEISNIISGSSYYSTDEIHPLTQKSLEIYLHKNK